MKSLRHGMIFAFLILCLSVFCRADNDGKNKPQPEELSLAEKSNLTEVLRITAKTPLKIKSLPVKPKRTYTLFLATRYDFETEAAIKTWIEKWNENQAEKFGRLILTDDLQEADLILAQYLDLMTEITETIYSPVLLTSVGGGMPERKTEKYSPLHSYILVPQTEGFAILWRQQKRAKHAEMRLEKKDASQKLTGALADLLKKRRN